MSTVYLVYFPFIFIFRPIIVSTTQFWAKVLKLDCTYVGRLRPNSPSHCGLQTPALRIEPIYAAVVCFAHIMLIRYLPLFAGLLPFIAMCGAYSIALIAETLPVCNPFIDGCVSISATGRTPPGSFLFKAIMLPLGVLYVFVWYFSVLWLRELNSLLSRTASGSILFFGVMGALALIIYVTFLGTNEPIYKFMRRTGIYFGFLGTGMAQLIISIVLYRINRNHPWLRMKGVILTMLLLSLGQYAFGVLNLGLKSILVNADAAENRIEWIVALLMQCHFVLLYWAWRVSGFTLSVQAARPGKH